MPGRIYNDTCAEIYACMDTKVLSTRSTSRRQTCSVLCVCVCVCVRMHKSVLLTWVDVCWSPDVKSSPRHAIKSFGLFGSVSPVLGALSCPVLSEVHYLRNNWGLKDNYSQFKPKMPKCPNLEAPWSAHVFQMPSESYFGPQFWNALWRLWEARGLQKVKK